MYDPRICLHYRLTFSLVIEHYVIVNLSYSEVGDISIQISIDATSVNGKLSTRQLENLEEKFRVLYGLNCKSNHQTYIR